MQGLFPDSEFYSTDYVCILILEQRYFYHCSFEIGNCVLKLGCVSPATFFFPKIFLLFNPLCNFM